MHAVLYCTRYNRMHHKKAVLGLGALLHERVVNVHDDRVACCSLCAGNSPTSSDVLICQGFTVAFRGGSHGAPQQQPQLGQESLSEDASLLLQPAHITPSGSATTSSQTIADYLQIAVTSNYCWSLELG